MLACQRIMTECRADRPLKFWAMENPVGHLIKILGEPRFKFQPWQFGDPWTKRTAIWGDFNIPLKTFEKWEDVTQNPHLYKRPGRNKPNMIWLHKAAKAHIPSMRHFFAPADRDFRAITPQGFARAFFEVNT